MNDDRIAALEEQVAHQSRAVELLDEVVRAQWTEIERLAREVRLLEARIEAMREDAPNDRPPPHY